MGPLSDWLMFLMVNILINLLATRIKEILLLKLHLAQTQSILSVGEQMDIFMYGI